MAISTRLDLLLFSFLCGGLSQTVAHAVSTETVRDFYQNGFHSVAFVQVEKKPGELCCPLWVAIPVDAGQYPVVQFQHGTELRNSDYTGLITQLASWGFIVVAPQMYHVASRNATAEITNARSILNWTKMGLEASLNTTFPNHRPDFDKVALAGHSRGGLVVFGLALHLGNTTLQAAGYSAIVGLDPVDAKSPTYTPTILTHVADSMDVGVPTLIVGTGLGSQRKWGWFSACAPEDRGHTQFYADLKPPSFHFVATENGHLDFTDDCKWWQTLTVVRCFPTCKAGPARQPMRQFAAGIMVAFLQDALLHNNASLAAALAQAVPTPVPVEVPESKGNLSATSEARRR